MRRCAIGSKCVVKAHSCQSEMVIRNGESEMVSRRDCGRRVRRRYAALRSREEGRQILAVERRATSQGLARNACISPKGNRNYSICCSPTVTTLQRVGAVWRFTRLWLYVCAVGPRRHACRFRTVNFVLPSGNKPIEQRREKVDDGLQRGQRCKRRF